MNVQGAAWGKDDGTLNDVLELAHISRPAMGGQLAQDPLSQARDTAVHAFGALSDEMGRQLRNVFTAFTKRRNVKREDAESIVEILAKATGVDLVLQVSIGRGEDSDIHVACAGVADTLEFALLDHAEELCLHRERHLPDFIEEEGAMIGHFETARAIGQRSGKGAFHMTEKFALE